MIREGYSVFHIFRLRRKNAADLQQVQIANPCQQGIVKGVELRLPSAAPASRVNFLGVGNVGNIRFILLVHAYALIPDDKSCNIQMIIPECTGKINHFL